MHLVWRAAKVEQQSEIGWQTSYYVVLHRACKTHILLRLIYYVLFRSCFGMLQFSGLLHRLLWRHGVHPLCSSLCLKCWQTNRGRHRHRAPPHLEEPGPYAKWLFVDFSSSFNTKLLARITGKRLDCNRPKWISKCRACWLHLATERTVVQVCWSVLPGFSCSYLKSHDQWSSLSVTYLFLCHFTQPHLTAGVAIGWCQTIFQYLPLRRQQVEEDVRIFKVSSTSSHLNGGISTNRGKETYLLLFQIPLCALSWFEGRSSFLLSPSTSVFWGSHVFNSFFSNTFYFTQVVQGFDQVTLVNPPEEPLPHLLLEVEYSCDDYSSVQLECVVSFDTGNTSTLPLRQWDCSPGGPKTRHLAVKLPDWLVYRADGIVPDYQGVEGCDLVASVRNFWFEEEDDLVTAQDVASLQLRPFFERPLKQHQLCLPWSTQVLQLRRSFSKRECLAEEGKIGKELENLSDLLWVVCCKPTKYGLWCRNAASAVVRLCLHRRKFRHHKITGTFSEWLPGVCAPQCCSCPLVRADTNGFLFSAFSASPPLWSCGAF